MKRVKIEVSGGCQCGAVRYHATEMYDNSHICHCRMCQKAVGNIFATLVAAPDDALTWTRGKPATFMSSDHAMRGYCKDCGTPLFYAGIGAGYVSLTVGSLDEPAKFPARVQMGSESRVDWFASLPSMPDEGPTGTGGDAAFVKAIEKSNRQHPDRDTPTWPDRRKPK